MAGDTYADPWQERNGAFAAQVELEAAVEAVRAHYNALAQPYLMQLRRNPGVRSTGLVAIEWERGRRISEIVQAHQRAEAYEMAAKDRPWRVATAHERAVEQAAARAFARDLPGGRRRCQGPETAGRDVHQTWVW